MVVEFDEKVDNEKGRRRRSFASTRAHTYVYETEVKCTKKVTHQGKKKTGVCEERDEGQPKEKVTLRRC